MKPLETFSYGLPIARKNPSAKMWASIIPLLLCIGFSSLLVSIVTFIWISVLIFYYTEITWISYWKLLMLPVGFLLISTVTIVFNQWDGTSRLIWGIALKSKIYGIDELSLSFGLNLILRALAAVNCMYFLALTTPMQDILAVLQRLRVPKLVLNLMELIYRYIFVLLEEAERMRKAQASRLGYQGFKRSVRSFGELLGQVFLRSYLRADKIYGALLARGFDGEINFFASDYESGKKLILTTSLLTLILLVVGIVERIVAN